jgi:hypothetical protein
VKTKQLLRFKGRNVPLKTHVLEYELPRFARRWLAVGLFCEDAAESIHALMNRLYRVYACIRGDSRRSQLVNSRLNLKQDATLAAESADFKKRRAIAPRGKLACSGKRRKTA